VEGFRNRAPAAVIEAEKSLGEMARFSKRRAAFENLPPELAISGGWI
jgi:hypothetical protein